MGIMKLAQEGSPSFIRTSNEIATWPYCTVFLGRWWDGGCAYTVEHMQPEMMEAQK